eukprot:TRINITY_DN1001_c0_g1_i1.p1 TRINITY_DN1001_c0_g1~~TRINITY_DN1001_c0_g1_i1.p1  ORF type:complete len:294 (+),score=26.48 TRINITY_DN1001_c0_g1_i1:2374-3255(+)
MARRDCTFAPPTVSKESLRSAHLLRWTCSRVSKCDSVRWQTPKSCAPNTALSLPLFDDYRGARGIFSVSHAKVLAQSVNALQEAVQDRIRNGSDSLKFTIDFPPERSESRAGTLVSRFENNLNFTEKLLAGLGVALENCERVGGEVSICDNINPQGGGEYLTDDECMVGFRTRQCAKLKSRSLLVLFNAGMDGSTLRQVKSLDSNDGSVVVLVNCGLDRLSWFAKRGFAKYIDEFIAAYYLKAVGNGWLLKIGTCPWRTFVQIGGKVKSINEADKKPNLVDVEQQIRIAIGSA